MMLIGADNGLYSPFIFVGGRNESSRLYTADEAGGDGVPHISLAATTEVCAQTATAWTFHFCWRADLLLSG